ncbi:MAG: molybdopterin-guanine dinucleotide biosynthesis protein B [Streptococcaceae bacterium]|nr:molybdopterin-guanine dinucleotide biosynthesis protein B [Streptococcaceae bacterium]MCL2858939.1 molybdopterin-guanine dinucleotide biosynthesis protein B [Streptococcaceae bacterium]
MKILQIVGNKKVGKTTTMVNFVEFAKSENLTVVCLKQAHEAQFDVEGTDTYKFAQAGADAVGLTVGNEMLWHEKTQTELSDLISKVSKDTDLLLLEGFRHVADYPRLTLIEKFKGEYNGIEYDLSDTMKRKDWLKQWLTN